MGALPLPALEKEKWYRRVRIRAVDDQVTITVDEGLVLRLDLPDLRSALAKQGRLRDGELDLRGGVGLWSNGQPASFSDASVTPLPSERSGP
jgi:hypothetical protein